MQKLKFIVWVIALVCLVSFKLQAFNFTEFEKSISIYKNIRHKPDLSLSEEEKNNIVLLAHKSEKEIEEYFKKLSQSEKEKFIEEILTFPDERFLYYVDFLKNSLESLPPKSRIREKAWERLDKIKAKKVLKSSLDITTRKAFGLKGVNVKVKREGNDFICDFLFETPQLEEITREGKKFIRLSLKGSGKTTTPGRPELPLYRTYLMLPPKSRVQISWTIGKTEKIKLEHPIFPYQIPPLDYKNYKFKFIWNRGFYRVDKYFPRKAVKYKFIKIYGQKFIFVSLAPVVYNPAKNVLEIRKSIKVKFRFLKGLSLPQENLIEDVSGKMPSNIRKFKNPVWKNILGESLLNKDEYSDGDKNDIGQEIFRDNFYNFQESVENDNEGADYLIITPHRFLNTLKTFIEWKEDLGFKVKVVEIGEIGKTSSKILDYLHTVVKNWKVLPSYLLLVGDVQLIPTVEEREPVYGDFMGYIPSDYPYSLLNNEDPLPDLLVGRIPADDENELRVMLEKIISYEKNLPARRKNYYKQILVSAVKEDGRIFHETQMWVANFLTTHGYKPLRVFSWQRGTHRKLLSSVNKGIILATYRGHGETTGWIDPPFNLDDVPHLNFPYPATYLATTCQSNKFSENKPDCFGEALIKKATGGAISYIGATMPSYSYYNDELLKGMVEKYPDFKGSVGELLLAGLTRMAEKYGIEDDQVIDQLYFYNILGDPSQHLWVEKPKKLKINIKKIDKSDKMVNIKIDAVDSEEILVAVRKGAKVEYYRGKTCSIDAEKGGAIRITVSRPGYIPWQKVFKF